MNGIYTQYTVYTVFYYLTLNCVNTIKIYILHVHDCEMRE